MLEENVLEENEVTYKESIEGAKARQQAQYCTMHIVGQVIEPTTTITMVMWLWL